MNINDGGQNKRIRESRRGKEASDEPGPRDAILTRLESFIRSNDIRVARLALWAGISRQYLLRLRKGDKEPTRPVMVAIAKAAGDWIGRRVRVAELFDVGER
jgi:hypothetical protein